MQQTSKYQFNLVEGSDDFSPTPLNQNIEKIEETLEGMETALSKTYTTDRRPAQIYQVILNSTHSIGDTLYTFPEQPEFVLVVGNYGLVLLRNGDTGQTIEYYTYNSNYSVTYQLSGKKLILYDKAENLTYAVLKCIVFR